VLAVRSVEALGLEVLAEIIADNFAFRPFLDEATSFAGPRLRGSDFRGRPYSRIFCVNRRDALPQTGQLFFYT
jgi:hypothetical protein